MGTLFGIALIIAFIFAAIDGATKPRRRRRRRSRRNNDGDGCLGCIAVFAIFICIWIGLLILNFIKAHSTAFSIGGIVLVLIIIVAVIVFKTTQTEEFPEDIEPTYPKIFEAKKFTPKEQVFSNRTSKQDPIPFTKEQLSVHPATYEDVVGTTSTAAEMAGKLGEDAVSRAVWAACQFDERHYKILRNVYVPTIDGYSEIDVLLLHETGIYVFESKNLSGSVYGDEKHPQWQQYKTNGKKDPIPNPILQNKRHIDNLCVFLKQNKYQFRAFSMIVFGNKSKLKYIPENKSLTSIHEICNLEIKLVKKMQSEQNFYNAETIDNWCRKLLPFTQLSEEEKRAHVERITKKFGKIN